jgi:flagella basal body P-ring formation protein FlgA
LSRFAERFAAHAPQLNTAPRLKAATTVVGEIVRIGDLVENAGAAANVPIFRSPGLGETGRVVASRVAEAVLAHGIIELDVHGLTEIVVTRSSRTISVDELAARIVRALADRQRGTDAGNLTLNFDSEVRALHVEPATDLRIARLTFDQRSGRFDVLFERPGSPRSYLRYTGTYAETFEAAVLARPLAIGEVVKASDITLQRRPKAEFGANVITSPAQAIGLAARRAMRPGDVFRQSDLAKPEVVARNDNVTITYEVPGITLTMRGKALEAGSQGDLVNVLNEHSKRSIQATVVGRGHVMIVAPARLHVTSATTPARLAADATGFSNSRANAK